MRPAVQGSPAARRPDPTDEIRTVVETPLYDLAVQLFKDKYVLWHGEADIESDEELTLDLKFQQDIEACERTLRETRARSDADWQKMVEDDYQEALTRDKEAEAEPEPEVPADLQAKLDAVKAIELPDGSKAQQKFMQSLVVRVDRVVPRKEGHPKPTKQDWHELKERNLKADQDALETARRRLEEEERGVARENELIRDIRHVLSILRK